MYDVTCSDMFFTCFLKAHMQRRHSGECPFACVPCGKSFQLSTGLRLHERSHAHMARCDETYGEENDCTGRGESSKLSGLYERSADSVQLYKCKHCVKLFKSRTSVREALASGASSLLLSSLVCGLCGLMFTKEYEAKACFYQRHKPLLTLC